jgi:hypothetical protein
MEDGLQEFYNKVGETPMGRDRVLHADAAQPPIPWNEKAPTFMGNYSAWGELKDETFMSVGVAREALESGFYRPVMTQMGVAIQRMQLQTDLIIRLPDSQSNAVVDEIKKFSGLARNFKERGLLHKRGVLLWGPPGSGKTCTIQQILDLLVNQHKGIALQVENPEMSVQALQMIRRVEPKRQIVAIMEDIDALISRYGESQYLALLDGESQVDNIVYVATTNYPESLDKRFVDRPSRFDTIRWIGMPSEEARRAYLKAKEKKWKKEELDYLVGGSHDFSIAHLRELLILTRCLGYSSEEALARLTTMKVKPPRSDDAPNKKQVGFAA